MRYLKPLRPFLGWSQLSIPTVYDDSLSYYEVLNKCIFHFNEMLKTMQENYEIIDEAFAKILEECEAAIARCEEAAARAEAAQSAAEKAQAAAEAAQAAAEAAQKLAEAAQAAAEAARDDAVTAQKAAEAAQAAAEAAQAAAEAAQQKAETAQAAAEAAQAKAEDAQEKAESARDAAQAAQTAAEAAQTKAEDAQTKAEAAKTAAESARDAAQAAQTAAESARDAAKAAQTAAESARDDAQAAQAAAESARDDAQAAQAAAEASEQAAANSATNAAESASNAAESASSAAESASSAETNATSAAESANQAAESATNASNSADAAHNSETNAADSAADAAASAEEIKNALDNYYDKTESDATFVKKAGDTMTGDLVMSNNAELIGNSSTSNTWKYSATEVQDLNDLKTGGIYRINGTNTLNSPVKQFLDVIVLTSYGSNIYTQIAISTIYNGSAYLRVGNNDGFGNWAEFSDSNDLNKYLPLSGGTMTGKLVMESGEQPNTSEIYLDGASKRFKTILLSGNQDFNTLTDNGIYCRNGGPGTDTNAPVEYSNFILVVLAFDKSNKVLKQLYFAGGVKPNVYIRFIYTDGENPIYGNWEKIATTAEINNSLSGYLPLTGGTMTGNINVQDEWTDTFTGLSKGNYTTIINENSDLNDVKTNCINFYPTSVVTSEESKNFPTKSSGFLVSLCRDSLTYIRQIYYVTLYNDIYTRIYNSTSSSWSNWEKILFETDIVGNYLPLSGGTITGNLIVNGDFTATGDTITLSNSNTSKMNLEDESIMFTFGGNQFIFNSDGLASMTGIKIGSKNYLININNNGISFTDGSDLYGFKFDFTSSSSAIYGKPTFKIGSTTTDSILFQLSDNDINITNTGINVGNMGISDLREPTNAKDAVTKNYVDNAISSAGSGEIKLSSSEGHYYRISKVGNIYHLEMWTATPQTLSASGSGGVFVTNSVNINFSEDAEIVTLINNMKDRLVYTVGYSTTIQNSDPVVLAEIEKKDKNVKIKMNALLGSQGGTTHVYISNGTKIMDAIVTTE